jgi:hypothetical protein
LFTVLWLTNFRLFLLISLEYSGQMNTLKNNYNSW